MTFRILNNEEKKTAVSPSRGKQTSVDLKMELVKKNFPVDRSQSYIMDFRENKNFYKSQFQLRALPAAQAFPPDKFSCHSSINFLTNSNPKVLPTRPILDSGTDFGTYCDTQGPYSLLQQNRVDNFRNFKKLRRQMDKAYLMLRRTDPLFTKEPSSDRGVKLGLMDGGSEVYRNPQSLEECETQFQEIAGAFSDMHRSQKSFG
jgi:hypothetical protein